MPPEPAEPTPTATPQAPPQAPGREIDVLVVDDHAIWRDGIRSILEDTEFRVVGEASSGQEGVAQVRALQPQIVLLDIRMAGGDGLDALRTIKVEHPQTSVVMLSSYESPTYMARAVAGGASGYLFKGLKRMELMAALRAVAEGEMLLSREDLARSLRGLSQSESPSQGENPRGAAKQAQDLIEPLRKREIDVLRLLATGLGNREIGALLFVSENTIKTHVVHIIGKLGVSDRVQAAVWAARHGLLESA